MGGTADPGPATWDNAPDMHSDTPPLTVLGAGYVGAALWRRFPAAMATRRRPASGALAFDLADEASWNNLPCAGRHVVWTFAAEPPARVRAFHEACLKHAASLIVLGSTSAYRVDDEASVPRLDEDAPLDLSLPRVEGEEWLRAQGAAVLRLAGLFGPGREPADWLRRGRIGDGSKLVNLIHVDDVVDAIAALLAHPRPGAHINASNGEPTTWHALAADLRARGALPADWRLPESTAAPHGKRIDNRRLRELLPGHVFRLP